MLFLHRGWRCKPPVFPSKVEFFQVELQSVFEAMRWMDTLISSEETNQGIRIYLSLHLGYDIDMTFVCFWQRSQDHQRCLYDNSFLINSVSSTGKDSTKQHGSALPADEDPRQGPGWAECYPTWDLSGPSWLLIRGDHFGWCSVGGKTLGIWEDDWPLGFCSKLFLGDGQALIK